MKIRLNILALIMASFALTSCESYLEGMDSSALSPDEVVEVLKTNESALIEGIYASAQYDYYAGDCADLKSIHMANDLLSGDMVMHFSCWYIYDYTMLFSEASYRRTTQIWGHSYSQIRACNTIICLYDGISEDELTTAQKNLIGEALAIRAYYYFLLVNSYQFGGEWDNIKDLPAVPLAVTDGLEALPRSTVAEVYAQMMEDASTAVEYLAGVNKGCTSIGEAAAQLIYARIALYCEEWDIAQTLAANVVASTQLMPTNQYTVYAENEGVYSHGSDKDLWSGYFDNISNVEWLWGSEVNALNASSYVSFSSHIDSYTNDGWAIDSEKCIDRKLYNTMEDNDVRKYAFGGEYTYEDYEYKYAEDDVDKKEEPIDSTLVLVVVDYMSHHQRKFVDGEGSFRMDYLYLRAAEAHYIKAEAEARKGDIAAAKASLDLISNARAIDGAHSYTWESDATGLIDQIFNHKRVEMWGEGISLFEHNRLEKDINRFYEGSNHPEKVLYYGDIELKYGDGARRYQIPTAELTANPYINDEDQNAGH